MATIHDNLQHRAVFQKKTKILVVEIFSKNFSLQKSIE